MVDSDKLYRMNTKVNEAYRLALEIPTRENIDRYNELEEEYVIAKRMRKHGTEKLLQR